MIERLYIQCHDFGKVQFPGLAGGHLVCAFISSSFCECQYPNSSLVELAFDKTTSQHNNLILTQFILSSQGPPYISTRISSQGSVANIKLRSPSFITHHFILFFSLMLWLLPLCLIHNCFSLFINLNHFLIIKIFS